MDYKKLYSDTAQSIKASAIRELLKVTARPEIISFAGGLPDSNLFPEQEIKQSFIGNTMATSVPQDLFSTK